jgi:hypothetical protein
MRKIKFERIILFFVSLFVVFSLISNISISFIDKNVLGIFSIRNLFLLIFLLILSYKSKFSTFSLTLLCLFFWYKFFLKNQLEAYYSNALLYYTININEILSSFFSNQRLSKIILTVPFISFLLLTFIFLPRSLAHLSHTKH